MGVKLNKKMLSNEAAVLNEHEVLLKIRTCFIARPQQMTIFNDNDDNNVNEDENL